jgi:stage II sporulation protein R
VVLSKGISPYGIAVLAAIAVTGFVIQAQHAASTAYIAHDQDNLLRLHILANSDSSLDQDIKLAVRDALIPLLLVAADNGQRVGEVEQAVLAKKQLLIDTAEEVIRAAGKDYAVQVEFGDHYYERTDAVPSLPAGRYRTIRVLIGAASGRNWWCVLFPPMCMAQETVTAQPSTATKTFGMRIPIELRTRDISIGYLYRATNFLQETWKRFFPNAGI